MLCANGISIPKMSNSKKSFGELNNDFFANVKFLKTTQPFSEAFY